MIRLGLISDVHGNLPALKAVLARLDQAGVDHILCAGDLTGGPSVDQTTALLHQQQAVMIRGNSDTALLRHVHGHAPGECYTARQYALIRWNAVHTSRETLAFLETLPEERIFELDGCLPIHITHGSPGDPTGGLDPAEILGDLIPAARSARAPVLLVGHSHCQWSREIEGVLICNPGAVCGPLDGATAAQYAVAGWTGSAWQIMLCSVDYDLAEINLDFQESTLLEQGGPLARAFLASINTGRDIGREFLEHAFSLSPNGAIWVPDDIWDQAESSFPWPETAPL